MLRKGPLALLLTLLVLVLSPSAASAASLIPSPEVPFSDAPNSITVHLTPYKCLTETHGPYIALDNCVNSPEKLTGNATLLEAADRYYGGGVHSQVEGPTAASSQITDNQAVL